MPLSITRSSMIRKELFGLLGDDFSPRYSTGIKLFPARQTVREVHEAPRSVDAYPPIIEE